LSGTIRNDAVSDAAWDMLSRFRPESIGPYSPGLVGRLREIVNAEYDPRAERAVERNAVRLERIELGGVQCIEVTPPDWEAGHFLLHIYGGGFIAGSAFQDLTIAAPLARLVRAKAVLPDCRVAPESPFPAALHDVHSVYKALVQRAHVEAFALSGVSAGGNLALAMLKKALRDGADLPKACALFSPWADITNAGESLSANDGRDPFLGRDFLEMAASLYAGGTPPELPELSPLYGEFSARMPPTIITTGTRDLLQSQSLAVAEAMRKAGMDVDLQIFDEMWHVFEFYDELPEAARSVAMVAGFLRDHLAK